MGQEASLPQDGGDDFEEQARAPPSSVNPPPNNHPAHGGRPGSKMIGAMLHRTGAGHHQDFESKEAARAAASGGQMPFMNTNNIHGAATVMQQQQQQHHDHRQQEPPQNYPPHFHQWTPEEQQNYQRQQQLALMQQQQQQQQQHSHSAPHYYNSQQQSSGPAHPPAAASVNASTGGFYGSAAAGGKKGGRGKALMNSMRNLSIGNTIRSGVQATAHVAAATASAAVATAAAVNANVGKSNKGGAAEWETRWDEDDDDSDGEDETDSKPSAVGVATAPIHHHAAQQPPLRPGMDAGHLSPTTAARGAAAIDSNNKVHSPVPSSASSPQRANVVTPIRDGRKMAASDDGLEWDTGAQQDVASKPNVQMFLPLLRVLGKGSFGKVVLVQKRVGKERGSLFAMKILRKTHLVKRRQIERTRTERKVLSAVNHPFIMKLHYAFQSPDKLYLVLDYCPGGELFFHLSRFRRFPERVARFYSAELLLAIGHLHKRGIIYRDLKPENVLLDAEGHVKLGDFGLAKAGLKHPCEGATSMCGTPEYMAPEILSQQGHGFCVDYWGLGMLVYEMMTGLPPWYTTDRAKLFRRLKSAPLDIPNFFSAQSASCVSALLERDPRRRLGVTGVRTAMEHEFFRSINWRALYGRRVEAPIRPCEGWKAPDALDDTTPEMINTGNGMSQNPAATMTMNSADLDNQDLDAATANFDNTFTRMPVHTDEGPDQLDDSEAADQLNEDTFVGFTFDEKDKIAESAGRQRTQQYPQAHETAPQQPRTLD